MIRFVVAVLATGFATLLAAPTAQAQATAPDFPAQTAPRPARSTTPAEAARTQRQQQMTPEEAERDRQLRLMEARTGNTTFGMERTANASTAGQQTGGFTVRKFKELPGQEQKRGETRRVLMGAHTTGKPLVHSKKQHKFLFF